MFQSAQYKNKYNPQKAVFIFVEHSITYQNILNGMAKGQNIVMRRIILKFDITAAFLSYNAATS